MNSKIAIQVLTGDNEAQLATLKAEAMANGYKDTTHGLLAFIDQCEAQGLEANTSDYYRGIATISNP